MHVTPGSARNWTYIVERRGPNGWVAVADMMLYESLKIKYYPKICLQSLALLSGFRMDIMRSCFSHSLNPLPSTQPWPDDISEWSDSMRGVISKQINKPITFKCGLETTGIGPRTNRLLKWVENFNQEAGLVPVLFPTEKMQEYSPFALLDRSQSFASLTAHEKLALLAKAGTLQDLRVLVLQVSRIQP